MTINRSIAGVVLVGVMLMALVAVVQISLLAIRSIPTQYYFSLPASDQTDLDRDGIPDNRDDSDGDGVADSLDPTPYGESGGSIPKPRVNWGRRTLPTIE